MACQHSTNRKWVGRNGGSEAEDVISGGKLEVEAEDEQEVGAEGGAGGDCPCHLSRFKGLHCPSYVSPSYCYSLLLGPMPCFLAVPSLSSFYVSLLIHTNCCIASAADGLGSRVA